MELLIDSSTRYAFVAISDQGEISSEISWRSEQNHSVELVPAVRLLMKRANVTPKDIEAMFVAIGPGGFSAVRVGISFAKSFSVARDVPLVGVNTLDLEAYPYIGLGKPVCSVITAGRNKYYVGHFDNKEIRDTETDAKYGVESEQQLIDGICDNTLVCGEGLTSAKDMITNAMGSSVTVVRIHLPTRRPSSLASLGYGKWVDSNVDNPETIQPIYMHGGQIDSANKSGITKSRSKMQ